jgi:acyl-coenzyme A synthetase/AMP-(fatty) acid ligase
MSALRDATGAASGPNARMLWAPGAALSLQDIVGATSLGGRLGELVGRSVLIRTQGQFAAALALIELDGVAARLVLCPPDLAEEHLPAVIANAGIDAIVSDGPAPDLGPGGPAFFPIAATLAPLENRPETSQATEWLMFTSGTTGVPKMVIHSLAGLTGAIKPPAADAPPVVWGTFYDIRRYGGLQILLRALLTGGSMILSDAHEPAPAHLQRLGRLGVTHLSGTPSHWRRALMTPAIAAIAPGYVRLSGEVADQAVLDSLKSQFPNAAVGHAYASTEAGVGFEVNDGLEGFAADLIDRADGPVALRVVDGALQLRSARAASGYAGADMPALADAEGFVDTGDMVERRGDRYHFVGRRGGIINIGGLKVHPEEVEAVINRHPAVRMSLVKARRNPITGAIAVAEVVLNDAAGDLDAGLKDSILAACRGALPPFKVPAMLKFVPALNVTAGGKLERLHG